MKRPICCAILLLIFLSYPSTSSAEFEKSFKTKYSTIYYSQDKDMDSFLWRLGGQRLEIANDKALASSRVDRIVDRVHAILGMMPADLKFNIYLHRAPMEDMGRAFYDYKTKAIHISVDYASEGVVAHEIAHAVINKYFGSPPPTKIQEILTQYVDKYLWSDY